MRYLDLIIKYDVTGPRYTSYPPLPSWEVPPTQGQWPLDVNQGRWIDLYIHIPFCKNICHYCGCNRVKLCEENDLDKYISYVLKEWALYKKKCSSLNINALHLGGGSPSILSVKQLDQLLNPLFEGLDRPKINGSIEIDPRETKDLQLQTVFDYGIRRLSFGIQDFDQNVQEKIGRIQSFNQVADVVKCARLIGFEDINFDLIYGLPGQTVKQVEETFKKVAILKPDTVAFYSFAFVPHFAKNQNSIKADDLLQGMEKWKLLEAGRGQLLKSGYREVGMDHYALESSQLYKALKDGSLHRNFMGYVNHNVDTVIGLGMSAISTTPNSFVQNAKEFSLYYDQLERGNFPFSKGHVKTSDDKQTEKIIHDIMCKQKIKKTLVDIKRLQSFIDDKLIRIEGEDLVVSDAGKSFLRNICMAFDGRLLTTAQKAQFSRTI